MGVGAPVGNALCEVLEADPACSHILGVDRRAPPQLGDKLVFLPAGPDTDLREPFCEHAITHAVLLPAAAVGHAPDEPGSLPAAPAVRRFFEAAAAAGLQGVLIANGTGAYRPPNGATAPRCEGDPLFEPQAPGQRLPEDLVREQAAARFARAHPGCAVVSCRLAPVVGPGTAGVGHLLVRRKRLPVHPATTGERAPARLQFVHIEDAAAAIAELLFSGLSGVYNIASDDGVELEQIARALRRPLARPAPGLAGLLGRAATWLPPWGRRRSERALERHLEQALVLDNRKLKRDLGYVFRYTSEGAVLEHARRLAPR